MGWRRQQEWDERTVIILTHCIIFTVNKIYSVSSVRSFGNLAIKPICAMLKLHMQEVSHALPSQKLLT